MNVVVLRGVLSGTPTHRQLASGAALCSFDITTTLPDGTHSSVPVAWFHPPAGLDWCPGTQVVVAGTVQRRFFRVGGATQSRTEVVAGHVVVASDRRAARRLVQRVAAGLDEQGGPTTRRVRST